MTAEEAYKILMAKYPRYRVLVCFEYDEGIFFSIQPPDLEEGDFLLCGGRMVDKKTGEITYFDRHLDPELAKKVFVNENKVSLESILEYR